MPPRQDGRAETLAPGALPPPFFGAGAKSTAFRGFPGGGGGGMIMMPPGADGVVALHVAQQQMMGQQRASWAAPPQYNNMGPGGGY